MIHCKRCGTHYDQSYPHNCDEWSVAAMGKHVCIDCVLHHHTTLEELSAIPRGEYCKHLTPEYWAKEGYKRGWGDAAVCHFPDIEILRKDAGDIVKFIILNGTLRRPVTMEFDRKTGVVDASY